MPTTLDPGKPTQANHRFIRAVLNSLFEGDVLHIPKEYDRISQVFERLGGSWEEIFDGSIDQIGRLKKVIVFAYENGYLTKKDGWVQKPEQPEDGR